MEARRLVNLFYAGATLIAFVVFGKLFASVFRTIGMRDAHLLGREFTTSTLLGAVTAIALLFWAWRSAQVRPFVNEAGDELTKVTWPDWEETRDQSKVTIGITLIIATILWVFDQVFGNLTDLILS